MVMNKQKRDEEKTARQRATSSSPESLKIGGSTSYDFRGNKLTAYGGLLPIAAMLGKLGFSNWQKKRSLSNDQRERCRSTRCFT